MSLVDICRKNFLVTGNNGTVWEWLVIVRSSKDTILQPGEGWRVGVDDLRVEGGSHHFSLSASALLTF